MDPETSVEITAPSVEEAVIMGLMRLTATRDEVDIEVLDEGSRGFLGIGARGASVRVTLKPPAPEAPVVPVEPKVVVEPKPRVSEPVAAPVVPPQATEVEKPVVAPKPAAPDTIAKPTAVVVAPPVIKSEPVAASPAAPVKEPRAPRASRKSGRRSSQNAVDFDRALVASSAKEVAENLFPILQLQIESEWQQEDRPTLWIALCGRDANMLVGPRAKTLDSVQYLFRTLVHRRVDGDYNIVVDADGYRKRRRRSLESLAEAKASQAIESGRTIRLRPMPPHERRVIHIVLRKNDRVTTESVGKGRNRAITIVPQK